MRARCARALPIDFLDLKKNTHGRANSMLESVRPDINLKTTSRFQGAAARDGVDAQVSFEKQKTRQAIGCRKTVGNEEPS